jgi:GNAT superfamily N-acetyltransferase
MMQIRPCSSEDFGGVLDLLKQLWPEKPLDPVSLRTVYDRALECDFQRYICATDGGRIIGFASLSVKNNLWQEGFLGHVDELVVDSGYRGHGVGTELLEHLIVIARQRGCRLVELDTAFHRKEAHDFYERMGFENRGYVFSKSLSD